MDTFEHRRLMLRSGLDLAALRGVEFGPLCSPTVSRAEGNILYVDHATADELRKKYHGDANVDLAAICDVDIVCDDGVLTGKLPDRSVDYVIASHVAEHIPDLATWLIDIEAMLKPTGELRLVLPDKRFSFDYLRRVSSPAELLDCYLHKLRRPRILQILDCALGVAHVDARQAYARTLTDTEVVRVHTYDSAMAIARDAQATGKYVDVHCWVFTPESFAQCMEALVGAGLVKLACSRFVDTGYDVWEFFVFLQPCDDRQKALESWQEMRRNASDQKTQEMRRNTKDQEAIARLQEELSQLKAAIADSFLIRAGNAVPRPVRTVLRRIARGSWWLISGQLLAGLRGRGPRS